MRKPLAFEGRFLWHPKPADEELEAQHDYLRVEVFDRLQGYIDRGPAVAKWVKSYPTEEAAMRALVMALASARSVTPCHHTLHGEQGQKGGGE